MKKSLLFLLCLVAADCFSLSLSCKEPKVIENEITKEIIEWNYSFGDFYVLKDGVLIDAVIKPSVAGNKFRGVAVNVVESGSIKYSFNPAAGVSEESIIVSLAGQRKLISNYQFIVTYSDQEYCPSVIYSYTGFIPEKK